MVAIFLGSAVLAFEGSGRPTPTPTATPAPSAAFELSRPYSATSAWNTPIAPSAAVDPASTRMIGTITDPLSSDPTTYSFPVYLVEGSTPRYDVPATALGWTVVEASGSATVVDHLAGVPIPDGAQPSNGSDAQMILLDRVTGQEWDVWQAARTSGGWTVANGSVYSIAWDGMPTQYGSRGAGVPYLAGLIRPAEIRAGRIDHALAFAYHSPIAGRCVWPASKSDGKGTDPDQIPEGARLQLDPSLTDADLQQLGLDRTGLIIAHALQTYGMFLVDASGHPKIYAENLIANPGATDTWTDPAIALDANTAAKIPVDRLRVLALPAGYRTGAGPRHGDCYGP